MKRVARSRIMMNPKIVRESAARTRSERVLDRYIRGVEPAPVKKQKVESQKTGDQLTHKQAFDKIAMHLAAPGKFAKSVNLLLRLLTDNPHLIPIPDILAVLRTIAEHPSVNVQARPDSIQLFQLISTRFQTALSPPDQQLFNLWLFKVVKVNQLFTDDSLVFSAKMKEFLSVLDTMQREEQGQDWWHVVADSLGTVYAQMQTPWARVSLSPAVDFCIQHEHLFESEDRSRLSQLATSLKRDQLLRVQTVSEQVRGPLEANHAVSDNREEYTVVNGIDAWSSRQSGLSQ